MPAQSQSNGPNSNNSAKSHSKLNSVPVSVAPAQTHLLNQFPNTPSHSVVPQMMPPNTVLYSFPHNQIPVPQQHLNNSHSHSQAHQNIHPSNCFQYAFLAPQPNNYFGGNQQYVPANSFNPYHHFLGVPYHYNNQLQQQQQQQLNDDLQPQQQPQHSGSNSYNRDTTTPVSVNQATMPTGNHLNSNIQQAQMRQFNYHMNARFNQHPAQFSNENMAAYLQQFNPYACNPYVQVIQPNYYQAQYHPANESHTALIAATTVANGNLNSSGQQAAIHNQYAIHHSGQNEQMFNANNINLDATVAAADSTTRSSSVHSVNYENIPNGIINVAPQYNGDQMQQNIKYYPQNYQQEFNGGQSMVWQQNANINNGPITAVDDLILSSHSSNNNLVPNVANVPAPNGNYNQDPNKLNQSTVQLVNDTQQQLNIRSTLVSNDPTIVAEGVDKK